MHDNLGTTIGDVSTNSGYLTVISVIYQTNKFAKVKAQYLRAEFPMFVDASAPLFRAEGHQRHSIARYNDVYGVFGVQKGKSCV